MKRNKSDIITGIAGCKFGRLSRHLTNTQQIDLCPNCMCATKVLMDDDGNRYCGKCKQHRSKGVLDEPS